MKTTFRVLLLLISNSALVFFYSFKAQDQTCLQLKVSKSGRYLVKENGSPFFWLGDTGWNLFIKLNREEADRYLNDRKKKKFTIIQAHLLGWKIEDKNAYEEQAFLNENFSRPNESYWKHNDYIIDKADALGLYMALVPAWASTYTEEKKDKDGNSSATLLFSNDTAMAYKYGFFLGNRYKRKKNIVWVLGGDVWGRKDAIYDNLAKGLTDGAANGIANNILITFHPQGGTFRPPATSTGEFYHNKAWLDFNMIQSGHNKDNKNYERISKDYLLKPVKPTLESEPCYEQHPVKHKFENGVFNSWDVRRRAYWSLFSGGFGFTYGGNGIWQMDKPGSVFQQTHFNNYWFDALDYEGARQMKHVRSLMESRSTLSPERVPDQTILMSDSGRADDRVQCTRASDHSYFMIYTTNGRPFVIDLSKMAGAYVHAWWYSPRDGKNYNGEHEPIRLPFKISKDKNRFDPPGEVADGNDWVLILDVFSKKFIPPGSGNIDR